MELTDIQILLHEYSLLIDIPATLRAVLRQDQPLIDISISAAVALDGRVPPDILLHYHKSETPEYWTEECIRIQVQILAEACRNAVADANRDKFIQTLPQTWTVCGELFTIKGMRHELERAEFYAGDIL